MSPLRLAGALLLAALLGLPDAARPSRAHGAAARAAFPPASRADDAATASPNPGPAGAEVRFRAPSLGDSSLYAWDFGDGTPPTDFAPDSSVVHRYARPGRYAVLARVRAGEARSTHALFVLAHEALPARRPAASSSIVVDAARGRVWTVNPDHGTVACLDARAPARLFEVPVGRNPRSLALAPDGTVWVANEDDATLSVLAPGDGALLATIALPFASRPAALVFAPDGSAAYVGLSALGSVARVDASSRRVDKVASVIPHPRALAATFDGRLLAARFLSGGPAGEVAEADAATLAVTRRLALPEDPGPDAENSGRGSPNHLAALAISPDGARAWVAAKKDNLLRGLARDGQPLTFESTVRAMLARLDLGAGREEAGARLDVDDSEGPSALAPGPLGFPLFAAFQGSNKVVVLDPYANARLMTLPGTGHAPQGLAVDSATGRLFVQAYLSRSVAVYDVASLLAGGEAAAAFLAAVPTTASEPLSGAVLRGKRIFHDASDPRMSRDGYLACASCHPAGGSDGRVWDFTHRGEGLRRTQSLLGKAGMGHGALHWSANFDEVQDFEHDIRGDFGGRGFLPDAEFLAQGRDRPLGAPKAGFSDDLDALAAYVASLTAVPPSPHRAPDGSMTADAKAGKALFHREDVGCARCHSGPAFTDSRLPAPGVGALLHDVGTLGPGSGRRAGDTLAGLDTPGLRGVWAGGPWLHDGSAASLEDVLDARNPDDRHGATRSLTDGERRQLAAYLLQLDDLGEGPAPIAPRRPPGAAPRLIARPDGRGGWRLAFTAGSAAPDAAASLRVHDLAGRRMASPAPFPSEEGAREWSWELPGGPGSRAGTLILQACAAGECAGAKLLPGREAAMGGGARAR